LVADPLVQYVPPRTLVCFHQYSPCRAVAAPFTVTTLVALANPFTDATPGVTMLVYWFKRFAV